MKNHEDFTYIKLASYNVFSGPTVNIESTLGAHKGITHCYSELSNFLDIFFSVISKTEWTNKKVFESPFLQQATQTIFSTNIADGGQNQLFNILLFERKI